MLGLLFFATRLRTQYEKAVLGPWGKVIYE